MPSISTCRDASVFPNRIRGHRAHHGMRLGASCREDIRMLIITRDDDDDDDQFTGHEENHAGSKH